MAALYSQGRVRHAGRFPELEDEMCDFGPDGLSGGRSPDRVDALVWAISELMPRRAAEPRIRDFVRAVGNREYASQWTGQERRSLLVLTDHYSH